ncbi:predicted protein [Chaetoceros tenuissimus]|uniref:Beta-lactamase-related domain-containing protein n=1 Tax=Chaetoceros tenuissimus TaxID=426638 RepID=A0AAD3HEU1_9STRA|nr:predicted protein [Chaetoceros tenuissimus]
MKLEILILVLRAFTGVPTRRMVAGITISNPVDSGEFKYWNHEGAPHAITRLAGPDLYSHGGLHLEGNAHCNSCKQNELAQCCSFRYENGLIAKQVIVEHPNFAQCFQSCNIFQVSSITKMFLGINAHITAWALTLMVVEVKESNA